jgi:hypothetical protein
VKNIFFLRNFLTLGLESGVLKMMCSKMSFTFQKVENL